MVRQALRSLVQDWPVTSLAVLLRPCADAKCLRGFVVRQASMLTAARVALGVLAAVAAAAGLFTTCLPARRAARADPLEALRAE